MKRNTIKKLGIIIMSVMIVASPVVAPFTTMTVYATERVFDVEGGTIDENESYDTNKANNVINYGSIDNNSGTIVANEGRVDYNYQPIKDNNGTVNNNKHTITNNNDTVGINGEQGPARGKIVNNYGTVVGNASSGTIENNYGIVNTNRGTVENNYTTIDGKGGIITDEYDGTVTNQWYEVKLENNTTDLKIRGNSIQDINNSGNTDVFAHQATSITIYSANPAKIIDAIEGDLAYVKNSDGTITINDIQSIYSIITILADKILAPANNENDNKEEVVIEISTPAQPQIKTPAGAVTATTVVAKNPVAAVMAALTLQNDTVVAAQAKELSAHMETVDVAFKEIVVKELAAAPNQAREGSTEYAAKQVAIVNDLTNQMKVINSLTVQSLAVIQRVGVSVAVGGCTKLEAANVSLINEILGKGIPVKLTYARNGRPVTIKIPIGVDITRFIGADGKLDFAKLRAYIVR